MVEVKVLDVTPTSLVDHMISAFLIIGDEKSAIIDPGPESSRQKLLSELEAHGVKPDYIVLTHIHLDHGGAAGGLARDLPGSKILVHPRGAKHIVNPTKLWNASLQVLGSLAEIYGKPVPAPAESVVEAADNINIDLGGATLRIIHTPGHASHHMSILLEPQRILFTGDSAGVIVKVDPYPKVSIPTTPPPFKAELYMESVRKMAELKPSYVAPTHYGIHDADNYLERHLDQIHRWIDAAREADTSDPDELAAVIASFDDNVKMILGVPELMFLKDLFLSSTLMGIIDYVAQNKP
jgi:glyoxylase-like metal-dependent hydrolase (beta-lactamase superfamily II)